MTTKMVNGIWKGGRCSYGALTFWPERGLIHIENKEDGQYECISVREALCRLRAIVGSADRTQYPSDRKKMLDFADHMFKCCKIAREQGDPHHPKSLKEMMNRRKSATIKLPTIVNPHNGQEYFKEPIIH